MPLVGGNDGLAVVRIAEKIEDMIKSKGSSNNLR